jgi:hypothetical protein
MQPPMETAADDPQRREEPESAVPERAAKPEADEPSVDPESPGDDDAFVPL